MDITSHSHRVMFTVDALLSAIAITDGNKQSEINF
jgi:hypothetical protein